MIKFPEIIMLNGDWENANGTIMGKNVTKWIYINSTQIEAYHSSQSNVSNNWSGIITVARSERPLSKNNYCPFTRPNTWMEQTHIKHSVTFSLKIIIKKKEQNIWNVLLIGFHNLLKFLNFMFGNVIGQVHKHLKEQLWCLSLLRESRRLILLQSNKSNNNKNKTQKGQHQPTHFMLAKIIHKNSSIAYGVSEVQCRHKSWQSTIFMNIFPLIHRQIIIKW